MGARELYKRVRAQGAEAYPRRLCPFGYVSSSAMERSESAAAASLSRTHRYAAALCAPPTRAQNGRRCHAPPTRSPAHAPQTLQRAPVRKVDGHRRVEVDRAAVAGDRALKVLVLHLHVACRPPPARARPRRVERERARRVRGCTGARMLVPSALSFSASARASSLTSFAFSGTAAVCVCARARAWNRARIPISIAFFAPRLCAPLNPAPSIQRL